MLLNIELSNFFSIKETICIDFRAANIHTSRAKELAYNVMDWNGTKVLKSVGLFGPNASGKSNIIRAINFCCRMIFESDQHNEGVVFNFKPFKFDGYQNKPSRFYINFVCEDVEYEYSFELTTTEILRESLYYYPNGRKAKIFTRDEEANQVYSFGTAIQRPQDVAVSTSRKNLFLSRASSMNREVAQKLYRYFFSKFMLSLVPTNDLQAQLDFEKYKDLILKAMVICDNDIIDIEKREEIVRLPLPVVEGDVASAAPAQAKVVKFKTRHRRDPLQVFDMSTEESAGTQRLFLTLMNLFDVLRNNKPIMIDEFDIGMHTRLADFILDLTNASKGSQLLFTSHNTNLIDVKRLRRDQIVFVNKKEDSSTDVYSLYDYKDFRENMDAEKAYLQGRFDAVPYIESSVSALKALLEE